MTHAKAARMYRIIPDRGPATIVLGPDTASPTTISVSNAWMMQDDGGLQDIGHVNTELAKTTIYILDAELNPSNDGREIRSRDTITFAGTKYRLTQQGGGLVNNRTAWSCAVQKEFG